MLPSPRATKFFGTPLRIASLCMMLFISGCGSLPSLKNRAETNALDDAASQATFLGRSNETRVAAHASLSGLHTLPDAQDAFAARILLARSAEKTLDVQYYIWRKDLTGTMMFEALHQAADRGVRVRLLLDDNNTSGLDGPLAALDAHPNIEIRLFNPIVPRQFRLLGFISDFSRVNRRMHNKSFTADNQATIIGGRNIGDEYFGAADGVLFADLDVLAIGPVVKDVSRDFDRYWNSGSAYPAKLLLAPLEPAELEQLSAEASRIETHPAADAYIQSLRKSALLTQLATGDLPMEWAPTRMLSDHPDKGLGRATDDQLLTHDLLKIISASASNIELISPYFVPTATGVRALTSMAEKGVRIRILTNSLDATDVAAVHAGYAKYRSPLLRAGIELFELRRLSSSPPQHQGATKFGSSGSSLHAKTFAIDNKRVFIGSFNFDPRSARLNTEMGFIIDSPAMATQISKAFDERITAHAYSVHLSDNGKPYWNETIGDETVRHEAEPDTSGWQRAIVRLLSFLPIEWLL